VTFPGVHVTFPGVHVTFPGVPLAAVVPAAPPVGRSRRPGRVFRGGSGLGGGSSARGCTKYSMEPGSTTIFFPAAAPPARQVLSRHTGTAGPGGADPGGRASAALPPAITAPAASGLPPGKGSSLRHSHTHGPQGAPTDRRAGRGRPYGPQGSVKRSVTCGHRPKPFNFCRSGKKGCARRLGQRWFCLPLDALPQPKCDLGYVE